MSIVTKAIEWVNPFKGKLILGSFGALAIFAAIQTYQVHRKSKQLDDAEKTLVVERVNHQITKQSLNTLTNEMTKLVEEGKIRQQRLDDAMVEISEETLPLQIKADEIKKNGLSTDYVKQMKDAGL